MWYAVILSDAAKFSKPTLKFSVLLAARPERECRTCLADRSGAPLKHRANFVPLSKDPFKETSPGSVNSTENEAFVIAVYIISIIWGPLRLLHSVA